MLKRLLIAALAAGVLAGPAQAQTVRSLLMPGVTYERQVQFTAYGPVAIHVLTAPRPTGAYALKPVLSNGVVLGRETVSSMTRGLSRDYTAAGINGDLFDWDEGRPSSILMRSGAVDHSSNPDRSSLGITADGTLLVDKVRMFGTWRGTGERRTMDVNQPPGANGAALFTPSWGGATPAADGTVEAVIDPLPPATTGSDVTGPVVGIKANGNTPIPRTGAVLVLRGTSAQRFNAEAPVGTAMAFRILLNPDWPSAGVVDAIGGGPVLVRDGKPVFHAAEQFTTDQLSRNPRTGIGQLANGKIVMVVTDGRQRGYSVGMTNFELAQTMARLGAVTAVAMDAGGSSTMAFDGTLLNRPSDPGGERPVSECLCLLYSGVYAPPASEPILSPNGDGVDETQALSYKLTRPSNVTVQLNGPNHIVRPVDAGAKGPGIYRFTWDGSATGGGQAPDGEWDLSVSATDDRGLATTATRGFFLNRTLAGLSLPTSVRVTKKAGGRLSGAFNLSRPARVTVRVETRAGAVVAVASRKQLAAGAQTLTWNGRAGGRAVRAGTYVLRVIAVNEVGSMDLTRQFRVRR